MFHVKIFIENLSLLIYKELHVLYIFIIYQCKDVNQFFSMIEASFKGQVIDNYATNKYRCLYPSAHLHEDPVTSQSDIPVQIQIDTIQIVYK